MVKKPNDTRDNAEHRRFILEKHIDHFEAKARKYTISDLHRLAKIAGYHVTYNTIKRDVILLRQSNPFVSDIARNYSYLVEQRFNEIKKIKQQAQKIHDTKWTNSKQVKKPMVIQGQIVEGYEVTMTQEIAAPKLKALEILLSCEKELQDILTGKTLRLSASMWKNKIESMEAENDYLKQQVKKLQEQKQDNSFDPVRKERDDDVDNK